MNDEELIKKYLPLKSQKKALEKLKKNYPVQYLIGNVEFYNSIIKVNKHVLIPRFETEFLVEKTLKYLNKLSIINPKILEIGTGSGCISIALKKEIEANIIAIDISKKAIKLAKQNAKDNSTHIDFIISSIEKFNTNDKFDLIISNPPYVSYNTIIDKKVKYEPKKAIYAKEKGLYFYKVIIKKLSNNLNNHYLIAFEIDNNQSKDIIKIIKQYLPKSFIKVEKDYNNYERYVFISNSSLIL